MFDFDCKCDYCRFDLTGGLDLCEIAEIAAKDPDFNNYCLLKGITSGFGCRWFSTEETDSPLLTKANFRAIREQIGLSQAALAEELGVNVKSVKRWESPNEPQIPPDEAWGIIVDEKDQFDLRVSEAVKAIEAMEEFAPEPLSGVQLVIYRDQKSYEDRVAPDRRVFFEYTRVNAATMAIAAIVENKGYAVMWSFQDDDDVAWLET